MLAAPTVPPLHCLVRYAIRLWRLIKIWRLFDLSGCAQMSRKREYISAAIYYYQTILLTLGF